MGLSTRDPKHDGAKSRSKPIGTYNTKVDLNYGRHVKEIGIGIFIESHNHKQQAKEKLHGIAKQYTT